MYIVKTPITVILNTLNYSSHRVFLLNFKNHRHPLPQFTGNALFSFPRDVLQEPVVNPAIQVATSPAPSRHPSGAGNPLSALGKSLDDIAESPTDSENGSVESTELSNERLVTAEVHDRRKPAQQ